jgi:1,4-alpha-glucan branching enzyme
MLNKQFQKNGKTCKVTFYTPADFQCETVHLVGDFNAWSETATPMTRLKDGRFKVAVNLDAGGEYAYRFLVDGNEWRNDPEADAYSPNPYFGDNSVVNTHTA